MVIIWIYFFTALNLLVFRLIAVITKTYWLKLHHIYFDYNHSNDWSPQLEWIIWLSYKWISLETLFSDLMFIDWFSKIYLWIGMNNRGFNSILARECSLGEGDFSEVVSSKINHQYVLRSMESKYQLSWKISKKT